jgi:hypothetical protein
MQIKIKPISLFFSPTTTTLPLSCARIPNNGIGSGSTRQVDGLFPSSRSAEQQEPPPSPSPSPSAAAHPLEQASWMREATHQRKMQSSSTRLPKPPLRQRRTGLVAACAARIDNNSALKQVKIGVL